MDIQRFDQPDGKVRVVATVRGMVVEQVVSTDFDDAWARLGRRLASKLKDATTRG